MRIILLIFSLYLTISQATAQVSTVRKAQINFNKAQEYLKSGEFAQSIISLNEAVQADPYFQYAFVQLGDINRRIREFGPAKIAYSRALALDSLRIDPRVHYGLAESNIYTGAYDEALFQVKLFLKKYKGNDSEFVNKAKKYLKDCEFAIQAIKAPQKYKPINLGKEINSSYRDYFPSITADGETLIFSRNIEGNEDFYISKKNADDWITPVKLSANINTKKYNEGAQSISPDGRYLFFTGCNRPDGLGRCDIYVSRKEGNNWGDPFNLGSPINTQYWESQPSISPDGSTLYFVSNRPGGIGGYDIWKSKLKNDGYWGSPENLGADINTPYDEHTPFIHPDGKTLYFSSDGWPGLGDKDIFMSRLNESGRWKEPENMGYPINTFNEETGLTVTPDGKEGLFSSVITGGYGDMDIYQFEMPDSKKPMAITYVKGIVKDKLTGKFLESKVQVVNLKSNDIEHSDYTSEETGNFLAVMPIGGNYAFNVLADGYLFYSEHYELNSGSLNNPFLLEILLEKLTIGSTLVLKNIFFDTNEYKLLNSSNAELITLTELLKNNPNISIEIQGHTDDIGTNESNLQLSHRRAKSVYDYLIDHQISAERLTYRGYGETKPITVNSDESKRKLNRRTSFIVTKLH